MSSFRIGGSSRLLVSRCISEKFSDSLGPNDSESLEVFHFNLLSSLLKVQSYVSHFDMNLHVESNNERVVIYWQEVNNHFL